MRRAKSTSSGLTASNYPKRIDSRLKLGIANERQITPLAVETRACLGVLSNFAPHEVPLELLRHSGVADIDDSLKFLHDNSW